MDALSLDYGAKKVFYFSKSPSSF